MRRTESDEIDSSVPTSGRFDIVGSHTTSNNVTVALSALSARAIRTSGVPATWHR